MNAFFRSLSFCALVLLVLASLFDPGNLLLNLKMPVFMILVGLSFGRDLVTGHRMAFDRNALAYSMLFLAIPLFSVLLYQVFSQGRQPYDGFQKLNTFLFLLLVPVILRDRVDILRIMTVCLTLQAFLTIGIFLAISAVPLIKTGLYVFGTGNGVFTFTQRTYASLTLNTVYFHTSSLMVIPLAYYADRWIRLPRKGAPFLLWAAVFSAMFLSGSRNNILFSVFTTYLVVLAGSRRKEAILSLGMIGAVLAAILFRDVLQAMFNSEDYSNSVKISYLGDYGREFNRIWTLLFGMGLGSFFYVENLADSFSITELTYLEILRNYGIVFGAAVMALLLYPLRRFFRPGHMPMRYLYIAYLMYLGISFTNPLFFSSSGILLLSCLFSESRKAEDARLRPVPGIG